MRRAFSGGTVVKADLARIKQYMAEIKRNSVELNQLIDENELTPNSIPMKAAKYIIIELAETMCNTIQHILAKEKGVAVSGYVDAVLKAYENGLISESLSKRLKPFFDFRNSLIHRYWTVDDRLLLENVRRGKHDFEDFMAEIESSLQADSGQT